MASLLDNLLQVTISSQTAGITRKGFGTPLIAAYHAVFPERVRAYTDPADMLTDGFTAGDAAYLAAVAIMSQVPAPQGFLVGRCAASAVAHVETFTPTVSVGTTYYLELADDDGIVATYSYLAVTGNTPTVICDAFRTAVNSSSQAVTASGTATLILTADVAGDVFSARVYTDPYEHLWARANSTADYGIATDLAAILAANDTWFWLVVDNQSEAIINAAAAWAETNRKFLAATTGDTAAITGAAGTGDVIDDQEVASRSFAFCFYSDRPHEYAAAGLVGRIAPLTPGSATGAYKTLRNVSTVVLSATHRANLEAKNGNWYCDVAGKGITFPGKTGLDFIDVTQIVEWVKARVQEDVFYTLTNADKVPFTDKGIAAIEGSIRSVWAEGVGNNALNDDLTVTVPKASAVSSVDKAARLLSGVKFRGTIQGAIHKLEIVGTILAVDNAA